MSARARLLAAATVVPGLLLGVLPAAGAASSPTTNPQAPLLADHALTSAPWGSPVVAPDGAGVVAAYVSPKSDGRHLYVSRWTPGGGWGPATQLFVGGVETSGVHVTVVSGRAAVWWFDDVGGSVRRMHVSVRDGIGAPWTAAHEVFRSNTSTFGTLAVGPAGVVALYNRRVFGPPDHSLMLAQTWTPGGWSGDHQLSANGDYLSDAAVVGARAVAWWREGDTGPLRYATLDAGTWSSAQDLTDPAKSCYPDTTGSSPSRYAVIVSCGTSEPYTYASYDWASGGAASPTTGSLAVPIGSFPGSMDVSGTSAAVVTVPSGNDGTIRLLRSAAAGSWAAPSTVSTSAWTGATVSISGAYAVVTWIELTSTTPKLTRLMSRVTPVADGTFPSRAVAVTPWGHVFFTTASAGSGGAMASWQTTVSGVPFVQAATWTARGGWSKPRTLVPQYKHSLISWTAVSGSNAMVGWASTSADGATAASLQDPRPQGAPTVSVRGRTLTCTAPRFSPAPAALSYRWLANGTAIPGGSSRSLPVGGSLLGKKLVCRVVASTQGFVPGSAYSSPVVVR